jgi:hypothetical protein
MWDLSKINAQAPAAESVVQTNGSVTCIDINQDTVMWAVDESFAQSPEIAVGVVHFLHDPATSATAPIQVSQLLLRFISNSLHRYWILSCSDLRNFHLQMHEVVFEAFILQTKKGKSLSLQEAERE